MTPTAWARSLFYCVSALVVVFEVARVYLIMPFPGSQESDTLQLAYHLHQWRWVIRSVSGLILLLSLRPTFREGSKWTAIGLMSLVSAAIYITNGPMMAETMFRQPEDLRFTSPSESGLDPQTLVMGLFLNGEAKAYPIRLMAYHHQVRDSIGGTPVMVTYCSVCRTGRIYTPSVNGTLSDFRLVGMDRYNAMFEDALTGTWWRQATGEAVAGPMKGNRLPELPMRQMSLQAWSQLYPETEVMRPDPAFAQHHDPDRKYEQGLSQSPLTRRDTMSGMPKSWVVGVKVQDREKLYDWNRLVRERVINDRIGDIPIVLALCPDGVSLVAFQRPDHVPFSLSGDTLVGSGSRYALDGRPLIDGAQHLNPVQAYQEYLHSWVQFHPESSQ